MGVGVVERHDAVGEVRDQQRDDAQRPAGRRPACGCRRRPRAGSWPPAEGCRRAGRRSRRASAAATACCRARTVRSARSMRRAQSPSVMISESISPARSRSGLRRRTSSSRPAICTGIDSQVDSVADRRERNVRVEQDSGSCTCRRRPSQYRKRPSANSHHGRRDSGRLRRMPTITATTPERPRRLITGPLPLNGGTSK